MNQPAGIAAHSLAVDWPEPHGIGVDHLFHPGRRDVSSFGNTQRRGFDTDPNNPDPWFACQSHVNSGNAHAFAEYSHTYNRCPNTFTGGSLKDPPFMFTWTSWADVDPLDYETWPSGDPEPV
jgi:hypothetical protein